MYLGPRLPDCIFLAMRIGHELVKTHVDAGIQPVIIVSNLGNNVFFLDCRRHNAMPPALLEFDGNRLGFSLDPPMIVKLELAQAGKVKFASNRSP